MFTACMGIQFIPKCLGISIMHAILLETLKLYKQMYMYKAYSHKLQSCSMWCDTAKLSEKKKKKMQISDSRISRILIV